MSLSINPPHVSLLIFHAFLNIDPDIHQRSMSVLFISGTRHICENLDYLKFNTPDLRPNILSNI